MTADARFWNKIADSYSKQPVADPAAFERKIEITKARMRPRDVVLDIGCGTGSLALRLAANCAHVHGVDASSEMTRIAREKAEASHSANVTFHCAAFDDDFKVFEPASLAGICAYSLLHLVDDRAATLARIFRLLEPGGFFISSTVCLGESWVPYAPVLSIMKAIGKAPMVKIFRKSTLLPEIRSAGFVDIQSPEVGAEPTIAFVVATKPH
jgi:arsenite methyltransferase